MLMLLTLTFKLVRARDQTRLSCELGANPFSSSRDISNQIKSNQIYLPTQNMKEKNRQETRSKAK